FLLEAGGADLAGHLRREDLDDDLAIERALGAEEEAAHAAAGELAVDAVCVTERGLEAGGEVGLGHGYEGNAERAAFPLPRHPALGNGQSGMGNGGNGK